MKGTDLFPICGIYKIKNNINKRIYIGKSTYIQSRWTLHISQLMSGIHSCKRMIEDFNTYGINAFNFYILEKCEPEILNEREQFYISLYKNKGYFLYNCGVNERFAKSKTTVRIFSRRLKEL